MPITKRERRGKIERTYPTERWSETAASRTASNTGSPLFQRTARKKVGSPEPDISTQRSGILRGSQRARSTLEIRIGDATGVHHRHSTNDPEGLRVLAANIQEQQRVCDTWRTEFNHVRPHEALGMKTPSEIYRPSNRRAIVRVGGLPQDSQRRVVDDRGWVRYEMVHVYVATALAGYTIGLRREGRTVTVWFYELCIGHFVYGEDISVQPLATVPGDDDAPRPHRCDKCKRRRGRPPKARNSANQTEQDQQSSVGSAGTGDPHGDQPVRQ